MRIKIAFVISLLPFSFLRVWFYRILLGYRISSGATLSFGVIIAVDSVRIGKSAIGRFTSFIGPFKLDIEDGVEIERGNEFYSLSGSRKRAFLKIGRDVHVAKLHMFDVSGGITIGAQTRIAGRGSQFWTHGGQRKETAITIGDRCYIASGVRMAQGVSIASNSFIGLGSVVTESFDEADVLIFGCPAIVIKRGIKARLSLSKVES